MVIKSYVDSFRRLFVTQRVDEEKVNAMALAGKITEDEKTYILTGEIPVVVEPVQEEEPTEVEVKMEEEESSPTDTEGEVKNEEGATEPTNEAGGQ